MARLAVAGGRAGVGALLLALSLAGCSGTPFGDRLAGSFSSSAPSPAAAPAVTPPAKAKATPATAGKGASAVVVNPKPAAKAEPAPTPVMAPAPYRITIKLPAGDPSAPAEVVTQALRAAGVPFEVEMIERITTQTPGPSQPR